MSADPPDWLPTREEGIGPTDQQRRIVESADYPMRVLAGAGTGKTFTMVRKIEHLIDSGVSPDEILALTFTNNAADSMREKLNATLGIPGYDVDAYTYHSICHAILADYAYEAGLDPGFDVATDPEKYAIVLDVLDEIEYRAVKPNVYGGDSYATGAASALLGFIGAMKRNGITPDDIDTYLGSPARVYDLAAIPDAIESVAQEHLNGRSVGSVLAGLPETRTDLEALRADLSDAGIESSVRRFLDQLLALVDALEFAFDAHERGERSLPENAYKLPKYLLGGYSSGAPAGIPDDLNLELTPILESFLDDCMAACDLVAGYRAYERELRERDLVDYDGLVIDTVDLLDTDAGAELSERWSYVFCDEFQDTDRLQFDLITALVSDDQLFVVGDDDQAIYEWRGANVTNITTALDDQYGSQLNDEPLAENFRSRQPILDLANTALQALDGREHPKTLTRVDDPDYSDTSIATITEAEEDPERAAQIANVVRNLLAGSPSDVDTAHAPGDIALLVRKHDHATPILEAFDDLGIPYQVAGDLATDSIGVGTVVAYLKALARPEGDEVSWNRVLTMRYRLHDSDLRTLNTSGEPLVTTLREAPLDSFQEPDRVAEVRDHVDTLLSMKESASLAHLYRELKDVTDIEWYLTEQERRDLSQLDNVVEQYGDDAVQPPLTPAFIDSLPHYESLFEESGTTPTSQPDLADDAINVMTIHKSKGLDFPVVIVPRLTADQWAPSTRSYDALETALTDGPARTFAEDYLARDARETRRVLHVALTRAEDRLILQGTGPDDEEPDDDDAASEMHETVADLLPGSLPWAPRRGHVPIWRDLQAALPPETADWTDTVAANVTGDIGGRIEHDSEVLDVAEARDRLLELGEQALDGDLDTARGEPVIHVDALTGRSEPQPAITHSYTSLDAFETCPRQHYLDYVVNAFDDYQDADDSEYTGVSQRAVGTLFHDTAELAAKRDTTDPDDWYAICARLASQRQQEDALAAATDCIDRYFQTALPTWILLDAERAFDLDLDGHHVTGFIDAVYRNSNGDLVVIDYKATERTRSLESDKQLPLYLLACRDLYDDPITHAGYAYVGPLGPKIDAREFTETELENVRVTAQKMMTEIEAGAYETYATGSHCQWCRHRDLPCGQEWLADQAGEPQD